MAHRLLDIIRYLRQLAHAEGTSGPGDAELLERYVRSRDEAAFELLVWRHGVLVLNVCRRILRRDQDIEDAFQATFLALVRKAPSIVRRGSIASWLYKVAYRIALEAKARARKLAVREQPGGELLGVQASPDPAWNELRSILDEELNRLPERLRRPFVLCYLEGKTNEEAARELGCRLGTIWSRLARGREILRHRLLRRGVTLSLAELTAHASEAAPAVPLMRAAARTALAFAGSSANDAISSRVAELTEGVLRTMFVNKIKLTAVMLLAVGLLAAGGVVTRHALRAAPQAKAEKKPPAVIRNDKDEKIAVRVIKPKAGQLVLKENQRAGVQASQQQQVVPLISGTIAEVNANIGDYVKKGQVLVVLDSPLMEKTVEEAAAALGIAEARMEESQAAAAAAEGEIRGKPGAKFKFDHARASVKAAKANVRLAKAALQKAQIQLEFTRLRAAFDGVVTKRNADPGNYVQVSDSRLLTPLLTLQKIDPVRVIVEVRGHFAPFVQRGIPAELELYDLPGRSITQIRISRFRPTLEQRAMRVEIDVPNADRALLPGMSGQATLHLSYSSPGLFVVPLSCVVTPGGSPHIWVVRDGKSHQMPITLEVENEKQLAIRGVKASDLIVLDNQSKLKEGTPVKIEKGP